jgi:hypothetical protein
MTRSARLITFACIVLAAGAVVGCGSDTPQGNSGSAGSSGRDGSGSAGIGVPSRGPIADAGSGIVVVGGSGGAAGAAGAPAGTGGMAGVGGAIGGGPGNDGGPTLPICPDGVRGNDVACDSAVDVICIADCVNNSRIRCGCTSRSQGQGDDRWVCGGQPQTCQ